MKVDKDTAAVLLLCESFYKSNQHAKNYSNDTMFLLISSGLQTFLKGIAILHEGLYQGWTADIGNPGYLVRMDAPAIMRAPYHLVPAFPTGNELNGIWKLSRLIKTYDDSIICLSGSGAVLKSSLLISDFDFCEYVKTKSKATVEALISKQLVKLPLIFRELRFNAHSWAELSSGIARSRLEAIDPAVEALSHAKIDFLAKAEGFRPSDVSNVLIFCDESYHSASMHRTFSAQEAHLEATVVVPNNLCNPYEAGRYIYWLRQQIRQYFEAANYNKFLKRSLSLTRFCFLPELSEQISSLIATSPECLETEIKAIDEISATISTMDFIERDRWLKELEECKTRAERDLAYRKAGRDGGTLAELSGDIFSQINRFFDGTARAA